MYKIFRSFFGLNLLKCMDNLLWQILPCCQVRGSGKQHAEFMFFLHALCVFRHCLRHISLCDWKLSSRKMFGVMHILILSDIYHHQLDLQLNKTSQQVIQWRFSYSWVDCVMNSLWPRDAIRRQISCSTLVCRAHCLGPSVLIKQNPGW